MSNEIKHNVKGDRSNKAIAQLIHLTLWEEMTFHWNEILHNFTDRLYDSLPARMRAVIGAKGGTTKY